MQFTQEDAAIDAEIQASQIYQQQTSLSWCQDGPDPQIAWILASQTLAGSIGRLFAAWFSAAYGRRASVWASSIIVLAGIILQATAGQLAQLVLGFIMTGLGLGIMYQAVLLEDAEIAPTNRRGIFVSLWQLGDQAGFALSNGGYSTKQHYTAGNPCQVW
jgi:MFS family permease